MIRATSPDGRWTFEDGWLRSGSLRFGVFEMDFFDRWTFARFLPGGELALAFETGQPWGEGGSYSSRYGGVQVLAPGADPRWWELVSIEFDYRAHDEVFEPLDVAWHRRGVLAWLNDGFLEAQVLATPREPETMPGLWPTSNHNLDVLFSFSAAGSWRSLEIDADGRYLRAYDEAGCDIFDLELRRRTRDGGDGEPLDVWTPHARRPGPPGAEPA